MLAPVMQRVIVVSALNTAWGRASYSVRSPQPTHTKVWAQNTYFFNPWGIFRLLNLFSCKWKII